MWKKNTIPGKFPRIFAALILTLSLGGCFGITSPQPLETQEQTPRSVATQIPDGAVLHAWMWRLDDVRTALPAIAAAGYKAVMVGPVQPTKTNNISSDQNGNWWNFYQPCDLAVGNQLGDEEALIKLCAAGEQAGVGILVDLVLNHVASTEQDGVLDPAVADWIKRDSSWLMHNHGTITNYQNRGNMTQHNLGNLPDWNTQNSTVQQKHLAFVNRLITNGVDGFRFDAAKHIELPQDDQIFRGNPNYWDTLISNNPSMAGLFNHGEVLPDKEDGNKDYQKLYRTTACQYLDTLHWGLENANLTTGNLVSLWHTVRDGQSGVDNYPQDHSKVIVYMENQDNFYYNSKVGTKTAAWTYEHRLEGSAIMSARSKLVNFVFTRPMENLWKDPQLAAVNNLRIASAGEGEYLRNADGNTAVLIIERGTQGAVIVNAGSGVNITASTSLPAGNYTDKGGSGLTFTVANGKLRGWMPSDRVITLGGSTPATMYLRGSFNGWGKADMTLTDGLWTATVSLSANAPYAFKFDKLGDWTTNWGASGTPGVAVLGGLNSTGTSTVSGSYTFTLNPETLAYGVKEPSQGVPGQFKILFKNNGNPQNVSFPGDGNLWSLTAATLNAAPGTTSTILIPQGVTADKLLLGSDPNALELKVVNGTTWNSQWVFSSWTLGPGIRLGDSGRQLILQCTPQDDVTLTIDVPGAKLSLTVQPF